ncbi:putative calcium-transporting ATPase 13, plasma membrane-type [Cornus florida]|uniref:putative calcium-transporting ATPase 13, plasma membrane-type n=1 Tax=Cornus florida TaxID=4283 RepID=UPI002898B4EA|nr:putative calcium-transporting ATPase 13, plasma membrane-type [Cornus florida]
MAVAAACDGRLVEGMRWRGERDDWDREINVESADTLPASHEDSSTFENPQRGIEPQHCQRIIINKIVEEKNLDPLRDFGVQGVAVALDTDLENGIPGDEQDLAQRRPYTLTQTQAPMPSIFRFLLEACNNYTIFVLILAAVLSIAFGVKKEGLQYCWFDSALVILTIIILITFPAIRNYRHEKRYWEKANKQKLSKETEMQVDVVRGGSLKQISIADVVCGDIVSLKRGYHVPADGLFVAGEALELDDGLQLIDDQNPFLSHGARVINGNARMIVTSVGTNTAWSEMMRTAMHSSTKKTTLESHLDKVSTGTHWAGLLICIIDLVALFLRFQLGKMDDENGYGASKGEPTALRIFVNSLKSTRVLTLLSISLVGMVEGIPFVITLAITYGNWKVASDKVSELNLQASVNMGSITTICTDRIGGVEVDKFWIGKEFINESLEISPNVVEALRYGIGTSTEAALQCWAEERLGMRKEILEQNCSILKQNGSNYREEPCGVLMEKKGSDGGKEMYLHWKGPARTILADCSHYYDREGNKHNMDEQVIEQAEREMMAFDLMIAFSCKPTDDQILEENDLILIGMLGLRNTKWEDTREAREAIKTCKAGRVKIVLVSGDDVSSLEPIALKCGLLTPGGDALVLTGEKFRNLTDEGRMEKVDRIRIMGNSLPSDRLLLIKCLRQKGEIVAAIGQRTNDAPALKQADIGLAMGSWSSEKVKESSDIIIRDGNFSVLVSIFKSGRCIFNNIQKFIQLELTMTISGAAINLIAIIFSGDAPITSLELIWVNLVVAFLGGLALLTEPPTEKLMTMPPNSPLVTLAMWRNIVTQALYQIGFSVALLYKGQAILGISEKAGKSLIFNSFVICQFFNQFNAREQQEKNVFKGVLQNGWFWVAVCAFQMCHLVFVVIEQITIHTASLNWKLWTCCFLIGIVSWPIDWAVKCVSIFIKNDWSGGWNINWNGKCTWGFIRKGSSMRSPLLPQNSVSMTTSAALSESA